MSDSVSDQAFELDAEVGKLLDKFRALIENRSAWADGIDGCREGLILLEQAKLRIQSIAEGAMQIESDLTSAKAQIENWSKMHAELSTVERDLRAECGRYSAAVEDQRLKRSNLRSLAEKLVREIAS